MARLTVSRAAAWRIGIAAAATGAAAIAGPAVAALAGAGGQPPAGSHGVQLHVRNAPNTQPPPGAGPARTSAKNAPNTQPVNLHPQRAGKSTQVHGPKEAAGPSVKARGRTDAHGGHGADRSAARTD